MLSLLSELQNLYSCAPVPTLNGNLIKTFFKYLHTFLDNWHFISVYVKQEQTFYF